MRTSRIRQSVLRTRSDLKKSRAEAKSPTSNSRALSKAPRASRTESSSSTTDMKGFLVKRNLSLRLSSPFAAGVPITPWYGRAHEMRSLRMTEREEQLGARRGELEVRLDHLRRRVRCRDLRVAQLDHAAGPVLIAPFRERQALARGEQRPSRRGDLRRRGQRLLEEWFERAVFVGLRREPVAGDVIVDGRLQTHGLVQEHLGSLVRVDRIDDRPLREGVVRLRLRQVDGRPCARLHESPDLRAVIVLVGQRLARDREELLEGDRVEEGSADLEEGLLQGDALLIRRRARAFLRRAPEVAGLPEVPDELRERHDVVEVTDAGPRSSQARSGGYAWTEEEVVGRSLPTRGGGQLREQSGAGLLDSPLGRLGVPSRRAKLRLP